MAKKPTKPTKPPSNAELYDLLETLIAAFKSFKKSVNARFTRIDHRTDWSNGAFPALLWGLYIAYGKCWRKNPKLAIVISLILYLFFAPVFKNLYMHHKDTFDYVLNNLLARLF